MALGCSSGSSRGSGGEAVDAADEPDMSAVATCTDNTAATFAPTYHAVYCEVLAPNCALAFCHGGSGDYLQLGTEGMGYGSLVDAPAQGPLCGPTGLKRVTPGSPYDSLMFLKVTDPPCGARMPFGYGYVPPLPRDQVNQIGQWIACGALPGSTACPADAGTFSWDGSYGDGSSE
jgi:hypothetical protein